MTKHIRVKQIIRANNMMHFSKGSIPNIMDVLDRVFEVVYLRGVEPKLEDFKVNDKYTYTIELNGVVYEGGK